MPILQSNTKDKLQDIYAPSYLHNQYVGKTVGLNYFGYPWIPLSTTQQHPILRRFNATLISPTKRGRWRKSVLYCGWTNHLVKYHFYRLFGIGHQTSECDESTYISRETFIDLPASIHLNEGMALMWIEHDHDICIDHDVAEPLPQARIRFAQLHGIEGTGIVGHKLTVRYDTRDRQLISARWTYVKRYLRCLG